MIPFVPVPMANPVPEQDPASYAGIERAEVVYQVPAGPSEAQPPIRFTARRQRRDFERQTLILEGDVQVAYGPSTIRADRVEIFDAPTEQRAVAEGNVSLTDPDATFSAQRLTLSWREDRRGAELTQVRASVRGASFTADRASLQPELWQFVNVDGTTCGERVPLYRIKSPLVTMVPGRSGRVTRPTLFLFNRRILTLPSQPINLDKRVDGIGLPSLSYRPDSGLGVSWNPTILVNEQTAIGVNGAFFRSALPSYGARWSRSTVSFTESQQQIVPRDDLGERFNVSYFDTVEIARPQDEYRFLGDKRRTFGVQTQWNAASALDPSPTRYSKPLEVAYEISGRNPWGATYSSVRSGGLQTSTKRVVRTSGQVSHAFRPWAIRENLVAYSRLDAYGTVGGQPFAWLRGTVGVAYQPIPEVLLGTALVAGDSTGRADFLFDELPDRFNLNLRADFLLGRTRIQLLTKRALIPGRFSGWFDTQFAIGQVVGCAEVFVLSKREPRDYRFGVKLRLDQFVDLLQQRNFERQPRKRTIISAEP